MTRTLRSLALPAFVVAPLAMLAACGGTPGGNTAAATTNITGAQGDTADAVEKLPEGQRTAVLLRAIRDAGQQCQTVTETVKVSTAGQPPAWQATCDTGKQWIVAIDAAGTATVTDRAGLRAQGDRTS